MRPSLSAASLAACLLAAGLASGALAQSPTAPASSEPASTGVQPAVVGYDLGTTTIDQPAQADLNPDFLDPGMQAVANIFDQ